MTFRAYYLTAEDELKRDLSRAEIVDAFRSRRGLLWVDVTQPATADAELLERDLGLHHLAVEDCLSPRIHPPKIDDFGDYLFMVVHGINYGVESDVVETAEMGVFLGPHFVVSSHAFPLYSVAAVSQLVERDGRLMKRGADFLAHALLDALIDNVLPTVDKMSEVAGDIEEEVIQSPKPATLHAILKLKRSALKIHRVVAPQREIINRLSRGEFPQIKEEARVFYRDVYDHLMRIEDLNQTNRDSADNALSTYLSAVANRQNETMRVLSIVATIFLPLTLVAGIYGMNFEYMPELEWRWGYFAVLGLIGLVIAVALWWFWAKSWITWGQRRVSRVRPLAVEREKLRSYIGHLPKLPGSKNK